MPAAFVDDGLLDHRKTFALMRLTGWDRMQTIGRLASMWSWALRNREDGKLGEVPSSVLASRMDLPPANGDAALAAMVEAGFLNPDRSIHDWDIHTAAFRLKRDRDKRYRERLRRESLSNASSVVAGVVVNGDVCSVVNGDARDTDPDPDPDPDRDPDPPPPGGVGGSASKEGKQDRNPPSETKAHPPLKAGFVSRAYGDLQAAWASLPFAPVQDWHGGRDAAFVVRMQQDPFFAAHWREALTRAKASPFLRGEVKGKPMSVDLFLREGTVAAILEGKYDAERPQAAPGKPKPPAPRVEDFPPSLRGLLAQWAKHLGRPLTAEEVSLEWSEFRAIGVEMSYRVNLEARVKAAWDAASSKPGVR